MLLNMAGPYDYSINIPQPPAQNFLQSLTGIMQLRQMQEQSALQQQQAAIAQQNAAFQQQMQPLEMERVRAGIAAAKAGTSATQTSQQAAAYQLQQRKDLDAELLGLSSDPSKFTAENLQRLAVRFHSVDPTLLTRAGEMRKNMPDQAKIFGDNIAKNLVLTSVTGDSEEAIKQLDKQLEAAKNTPGLQDFVPKIEQLKDNFIKYPDQTVALAAVGQTLFAPDQGKAITDVLSEQAKIGKTKAETKKELALATETKQQKQVDEEKRALDLEKERLQIQEIRQKLDQARDEKVKVFASTNKFAKELSDASATNQQSADIARGILEKIDSGEVQIPSTVKGAAWQYVRDRIPFLGNDVTMLRKEYQKLANSEIIKSLPPGSASDADRRFAQEGVMSKDASPKQFRKGVEAMARLSEYASRYNEAKLAWVSQNAGSAGSALKEFLVFGAPIKKGTGFNAWWNTEGNKLDQNFMPDQAGTRADVDALLNKYR